MISKIDGSGPIRTPSSIRRVAKGSTEGDSFAKQLSETEESSSSSATSATSSMSLVSGVLGLQEVDDATARASRGKLRAESLLDQLDELRLELLSGSISREKLHRLVRMVNSRRATVDDPYLSGILDEIDLRAQVELAKYSQT